MNNQQLCSVASFIASNNDVQRRTKFEKKKKPKQGKKKQSLRATQERQRLHVYARLCCFMIPPPVLVLIDTFSIREEHLHTARFGHRHRGLEKRKRKKEKCGLAPPSSRAASLLLLGAFEFTFFLSSCNKAAKRRKPD